jgi:hypothetical protein
MTPVGPVRGPRWTVRQLEGVLALSYGADPRGGADTGAAATALGVSRRTVQRWLQGSPRARAKIPAARLQQITLPTPQVLRQEQLGADYAREAIARIALPKDRGVEDAWRTQRWLEPHLVAVLQVDVGRGVSVRQVTVSRGQTKSLQALRRRGTVVDFTVVPTRFHATVLVHELLVRVQPWRVLPLPEVVKVGRTQTWSATAPVVDLDQLAAALGLRPTPGGQG